MIARRRPVAAELVRLTILLALAGLSITVALPSLLALAAAAGR